MANISSADGKIILMGDWTQEALDAFRPVLNAWAFCTNIGGDGIRWCDSFDLQHLTAGFSGYGRWAFTYTLEGLDEGTRGWIAGHPADTSHPLTGSQYDDFLKILHDKDLYIKIEFADVDEECLEKSYHIGKLTSDGKSLDYTEISTGGHISYVPFYEDGEDWDGEEEDWNEDDFDVESIKDEVFYDCEEPVTVVIPDSVTKIGSLRFSGCKNLAGVSIPDSVTKIGCLEFSDCGKLESIIIPDSVTEIEEFSFEACTSLAHLAVPTAVTHLSDDMFCDCTNLTTVVAPHLPLAGFANAGVRQSLACGFAVAVEQGRTIADKRRKEYMDYIREYRETFYPSAAKIPALLRLMLTEKVLPDDAFAAVWELVKAERDVDAMTLLLDYQEKNMKPVCAEKRSEWEADIAAVGSLLTADATRLWNYTKNYDGTYIITGYKGAFSKIAIPEKIGKIRVTEIGANACKDRKELTEVTIPDGVEIIDDEAFRDCKNLTRVNIPDSVIRIGYRAFSGCENLAGVTVPDSVRWIKGAVFWNCAKLADENGFVIVRDVLNSYHGNGGFVTVPDGVRRIGGSAFRDCENLTGISIPQSVTGIGKLAFHGCKNLADVAIPDSVKIIGEEAFSGCESLAGVTVPRKTEVIRYGAFANCRNLKSVFIHADKADIWDNVFSGCPDLVIHAPAESCAEKYAKEFGISFKTI